MKQDNKEWIDRAVDWLDKAELWGMTLITKVIAFITPIPVSLQTRKHAAQYLSYEFPWDWVIAIIVEFLGYAAIYKSLQFAEHNRRYSDPKNKAPFKLAIVTYVFYLAAVIIFNVIPEIATGQAGHIVAMNIVLALFSVPGGVLAGISAIFTERKAALRRPRTNTGEPANEQEEEPNSERQRTPANERQRTNERTQIPQPANERTETNESPMGFPTNERKTNILAYIEHVKTSEGRIPGPSEIARELGVSKGYASDVINGKA